jgi:thiol:disulfide interchange protein
MIVYLCADWAVASAQMERQVWSDPRVVREGRRFVALKIDVTTIGQDAELYAERYRVPSIPSAVILDARGERVAVLSGQATAEALLEAMKRASE